MLVVITYDISLTDKSGTSRLRKISKECVNYGQRVQNSVYECNVDASELALLKNKLLKIIDLNQDSLRIYKLGNNYKTKIEHYGVKVSYDAEDTLLI